ATFLEARNGMLKTSTRGATADRAERSKLLRISRSRMGALANTRRIAKPYQPRRTTTTRQHMGLPKALLHQDCRTSTSEMSSPARATGDQSGVQHASTGSQTEPTIAEK
ncbi:MAG: hypothetical protein Q9223_006672, partial [Gallowayella weberi]